MEPHRNRPMRTVLSVTLFVLAALLGISPDTLRAQPFAYVVNGTSNDVSVIDLSSNTVIETLGVGAGPFRVAITPDAKFAYVSNNTSNDVSVIEVASNTVIATVPIVEAPNAHPGSIAISPDGEFVYVSSTVPVPGSVAGGLSVISTATNEVVGSIVVGPGVTDIVITPDSAFAYLTNASGGRHPGISLLHRPRVSLRHSLPMSRHCGAAGSLDNGQANALTTKLEEALTKLNRGDPTAAANQLNAFINQVQAFINSGRLSAAQGQPLIDEANNAIDLM